MAKLSRPLGFGLVLMLMLFGIYEGTTGYLQRSAASNPSSTYHLNETALAQQLTTILQANRDLNMSVSITDLQTRQRYHYGETARYTAASVTKLITAAAYLQRIEAGQANFTDRVGNADARRQLTLLIVKSDNTAWQQLNDIITPEGLATYARGVGINSYDPVNNVVNSDDIALLLSKLASQKLLNETHTAFLLSLMAQANYRNYIVEAIPEGAEVYHKVGYLEDRLHEAALIKSGDRSYVLTVFSKSAHDAYAFSRGSAVFRDITRATLTAFRG